jgi:hypothetical protein
MRTYLRTSWTEKNPGRRNFGCAQYSKDPHCKYFEWFEPRICDRGSKLVYEMRVRIKTIEELCKQEKKEKRSNVLLFVSWGLSVALLFAFMCSF